MKKYIEVLEEMWGTWEENFKVEIKKANPNFEQDFNQILKAIPSEYIPDFIEWMINIGKINLVIENVENIIECIMQYKQNTKSWIKITLDLLINIKNPNIDKQISSHLMQIIKGPYQKGNLYLIFDLCNTCGKIESAIEIIEKNYTEIIESIFSKNEYISTHKEISCQIQTLISKIVEQEEINLSDITYLGSGRYSECIKIGNSVLKFGKNRILEELPKHRRILEPRLRRNVPTDYKDEIELENLKSKDVLALECQALIDTQWEKGLTEKEIEETLYMIYKELRNSNIVWTDIKVENVGKLIKPNLIEETIKNVEGEEVIRQIILPTGELVVFDTDRIYQKDKLPKFNESYLYEKCSYDEFEKRFCEEENIR